MKGRCLLLWHHRQPGKGVLPLQQMLGYMCCVWGHQDAPTPRVLVQLLRCSPLGRVVSVVFNLPYTVKYTCTQHTQRQQQRQQPGRAFERLLLPPSLCGC